MTVLQKYPEIKRLKLPEFKVRGKDYLTDDEMDLLLGKGDKIIQEKLDGSPNSVVYGKVQIFYEHLKVRHTIPYTHLPSWNIAFDLWNIPADKWLGVSGMHFFVNNFKWPPAPLLHRTLDPITPGELQKFLDYTSAFNPDTKIEGIVIKNYDADIFGKIINPEFEEALDDPENIHPQKRRLPVHNSLAPIGDKVICWDPRDA